MNIVQVGCHMGDDHVTDFISNNFCQNIILIDANPYALDICKEKYKSIENVTYLNYAIVPTYYNSNKFINLYIPKQDKTSMHCSLSLDFIKKHNHEEWIEEVVPCITLNELFTQLNFLQKIDRLYIDAEGLDSKIILSLDLSKIHIDYIFFEHTHSDGAFTHGANLKGVVEKLKDNMYRLKDYDQSNLGFERILER
jgi:FkbM family methyltransferase